MGYLGGRLWWWHLDLACQALLMSQTGAASVYTAAPGLCSTQACIAVGECCFAKGGGGAEGLHFQGRRTAACG